MRDALLIIERDLVVTERKAMTAARKTAAKVRQQALASKARRAPDVQERLMREITPLLRDAMLVADLRGRVRAQRLAKSGLQLSVFDSVISSLKEITGVDVERLRRRYGVQAFNLIRDLSVDVERGLRDEINLSIERGDTLKQGIDAMKSKLNALGVSPTNDFKLETVFRTQTQVAYGAGRWQADQDPAVQEILWGYEYSTVGDDRVREEHAALEGTRLPKDDPFWQRFWPPNGWNCRCVAIPIFQEETIVSPPPDAEPDAGFAFNAGELLRAA